MNIRFFFSFIRYCCIGVTLWGYTCFGQISGVVNTYIDVTAIDYACHRVTVSSASGYAVGDLVVLIQMKGASINTTVTSAAYGSLTSINDAGNYELQRILAITGNDIYFVHALLKTYTISGSVQLVRVPEYTNVSVNGTLTGSNWNGTTGGIVAIRASGTITLNAPIAADGIGFRGGNASLNDPSVSCSFFLNNFSLPASTLVSQKGEGIYSIPLNESSGRAKNTIGGGGGNNHNAGGGGGGLWGTGGQGGNQSNGCNNAATNAQGGIALNTQIPTRLFLGGGGGGGHQNNGQGTRGGNGGGIILLIADNIIGNGFLISGNGEAAPDGGGDGAGGGGSGGSILLQSNTFTNTIVQSNGGMGGDTNSPNRSLGPGGGGSGGVVYLSVATLPVGLTIQTTGGLPGFSTNALDPSLNGNRNATAGASGTTLFSTTVPFGIINNTCLLPLTLLEFSANKNTTGIQYTFRTLHEHSIEGYYILGSIDGIQFDAVDSILPLYASSIQTYSGTIPSYYNYIQLIEKTTSNHWVSLRILAVSSPALVRAYPNPAQDYIILEGLPNTFYSYTLYTNEGKEVEKGNFWGTLQVQTHLWSSGFYYINIKCETTFYTLKILLLHPE
ncbi:MAG: T9SS type A sorting domain-containing protein [Cytophagaceae bacterium]|nr:T9SS type A sorting domain-containing protein [Cytophagaceae bacterium]